MMSRRSFLGAAVWLAAAGSLAGCSSDGTAGVARGSAPGPVTADAMIYSFYGRLSVASLDADLLVGADLPPTFYCYGTRDPFYDQFEEQVELMASLGYTVHARVLEGWPHGFGALGDWIPEFDDFMQEAFALGGPSVSLS